MSAPGPAPRRAVRQDVPAIVRLLADDQLGRARERLVAQVEASPTLEGMVLVGSLARGESTR